MRCVVVSAAGATIRSFIVQQDSLLQFVQATSCAIAVSEDPTVLWSDIKTPAADGIRTNIFAWRGIETNSGEAPAGGPMKIPIKQGTRVYISFSGVGSAILYLDDIASAE